MPPWLLRGLILALLHGAGALVVAKTALYRDINNTVVTSIVFAVLIGVAVGWGSVDGWLRREDRFRNWFIGGLVAGPVAGVLSVIGRALFVDETGAAELAPALTSGAAFTALLVIMPAGLGMLVGLTMQPPHGQAADGAGPPTAPPRHVKKATRRPTGKAPVKPRPKAGQAPSAKPRSQAGEGQPRVGPGG